ncbi:MAG: PorP/SprF family type IX secretion system membrane protein [Pseudoflavonifractor sp.]|nr:PorP/SprF family type IX secretion system membrane protein [Pseudoflavonifractor sp.]
MPSTSLLRLAAVIIALTASILQASAQFAEPLMSQYYEMPAFYNPGATGLTDRINIRGGARLQWVGVEHAPVSFAAVGDMPFKLGSKRLGVGLALQQESYGLWRNMTLGAMASYQFKLFGGRLIPGLRIGLLNQSFRGSEVYLPDGDDFHQGTDDAIPTRDVGANALDLGAGIYFIKPRWNVGISLLHANAPTVTFEAEGTGTGGTLSPSRDGGDNGSGSEPSTPVPGEGSSDGQEVKKYEFPVARTLYFTAGGNIPIKDTLFEVMPSVMAAYDLSSEWTAIATARLRYNKMFTAGLSYRYRDGVALHLALEIKNFYIGYTYEYPLSDISKASSGSHEILAGYAFKLNLGDKNRNRQKSIRLL